MSRKSIQQVVIVGSRHQALAQRLRADISDTLVSVRLNDPDDIQDCIAKLRRDVVRFEHEILSLIVEKEESDG